MAARAKLPCGDCPLCRSERSEWCRAGPVIGFDLPGCFAERALLARDTEASAALGLSWAAFCLLCAFVVNAVGVCQLVVGRGAQAEQHPFQHALGVRHGDHLPGAAAELGEAGDRLDEDRLAIEESLGLVIGQGVERNDGAFGRLEDDFGHRTFRHLTDQPGLGQRSQLDPVSQ